MPFHPDDYRRMVELPDQVRAELAGRHQYIANIARLAGVDAAISAIEEIVDRRRPRSILDELEAEAD